MASTVTVLEFGCEWHTVLPPVAQHQQPVRWTHAVGFLDEQALGSELQHVRVVDAPRPRFLLDRDDVTVEPNEVIGPPYQPQSVRAERRRAKPAIVCGENQAIAQAEPAPTS